MGLNYQKHWQATVVQIAAPEIGYNHVVNESCREKGQSDI